MSHIVEQTREGGCLGAVFELAAAQDGGGAADDSAGDKVGDEAGVLGEDTVGFELGPGELGDAGG